MAEALFNKLSKKNEAISAGVEVWTEFEGKKISERTEYITLTMKEEKCDVSNNVSKQLTEDMVKRSDRVIVITEKNLCPDYLLNDKKVIFWDIEDAGGRDLNFHKYTRDKIKKKILKLIKDIG